MRMNSGELKISVEKLDQIRVAKKVTIDLFEGSETINLTKDHMKKIKSTLSGNAVVVFTNCVAQVPIHDQCRYVKIVCCDEAPNFPRLVTDDTEVEVAGVGLKIVKKFPLFCDVGGMEREIAQLREIVQLPIDQPGFLEKLGLRLPSGILLTGEPGTGKTFITKALANELDVPFISISGPELMNKFVGEGEKILREKFEEAEKAASPISIIFFDEIDSIAVRRDTGENQDSRFVSQLLTLMDGFADRKRVIVIATTNLPKRIDPACRRPRRFDIEIKFLKPNLSQREKLFALKFANQPVDKLNFYEMAFMTKGLTPADIDGIFTKSSQNCIHRCCVFDEKAGRWTMVPHEKEAIVQTDVIQAISDTLRRKEKMERDYGETVALNFSMTEPDD